MISFQFKPQFVFISLWFKFS